MTVIDLAQGVSGPLCSMYLGEFGARVVKVEPLPGDWARTLEPRIGRYSALFLALNRNKESVAMDWEGDRGKEVVHRLATKADIFIFDAGDARARELSLDYATLAVPNPSPIYGAITPFGEKGPWARNSASELMVQAASGYLRYLGQHGHEPLRIGADVASIDAGFLLQGVLAALFDRCRSGAGQRVAVSLLGSLLALKTIDDLCQHTHVVENRMMVDLASPHWGRIRVGGMPWSFSQTPGILRSGPLPGGDMETVLAEM